MAGMTGPVPYYGGRFTPAQAYAAAHPAAAAHPVAPAQPAAPAPPRQDPRAALDGLLESGVITADEHEQLRARLEP